jgi:ankyrin repeat protein
MLLSLLCSLVVQQGFAAKAKNKPYIALDPFAMNLEYRIEMLKDFMGNYCQTFEDIAKYAAEQLEFLFTCDRMRADPCIQRLTFVLPFLSLSQQQNIINKKTVNGLTYLHRAILSHISMDSYKVAAFLIDYGIDVKAQVKGGNTALHLAYMQFDDCKHIIKYLEETPGIDKTIKNDKGLTALESKIAFNVSENYFDKKDAFFDYALGLYQEAGIR